MRSRSKGALVMSKALTSPRSLLVCNQPQRLVTQNSMPVIALLSLATLLAGIWVARDGNIVVFDMLSFVWGTAGAFALFV